MKNILLFLYLSLFSFIAYATDTFVSFTPSSNYFPLITNGIPCPIKIDLNEDEGVKIAVDNLQKDIFNICGTKPEIITNSSKKRCILIGTYNTPLIQQLINTQKLQKEELNHKNEKYILQVITTPCEGIDEALIIAGSDKRGTIYGIYELSKQMGVSPWYWWADVPIMKQENIYIKPGIYTDGEPKVKYRGIFLNDEWPCLGNWSKETFGGFNSQFYKHVLNWYYA